MFWLGIIVTGITLTGFYLIPWSYYCLWMAAMVGGAFLVTGIYVRLRWTVRLFRQSSRQVRSPQAGLLTINSNGTA
jgi:TM2 domain-containing membrane protein YozV